MRAALLAIFIAGLALGACASDEPRCTVPTGVYPDWIRTIGCEADYELLWSERTDSVFARTATINWLIDREDGDRVYFIDSKEWELHYFFAAAYLDRPDLTPVGSHEEFNILNYRRENRRFVMGKLIHYRDQDLLTLEMSAGDTAGADMIVDAYQRVRDRIFDGDRLLYRPVSANQEAMLGELQDRIAVIRTAEVFAGQTYQPLNHGVGFGTLRFARPAELGAQPLLPTELIVLDRVPNDISLVSGIITGEFQTPLAHINILSKNRGTPNMALRDAFDDPQLRGFEGKLVRLEVGPQQYTIREATAAEAQSYWDSLRPTDDLVPVFDLSVTALQDLSALGASASNVIGAKAANLAEMTGIVNGQGIPLPLPEAPFAIPFSHYADHLEANGIDTEIAALLVDAPSLTPADLSQRLFDIRWRIYRAPMNATFRAALEAEVQSRWGTDRRARFRSSTNVEDLEGFSGAGLYTSAGAAISDGPGAIENAVKVVWASVWNHQAFVEREFYRVDHSRVYMGVLVHPSSPDDEANGVVVTINDFNRRRPAFYINSQLGEVSVTNPTGLAVPEQLLYYTWYEEPEYEVITRSSLLAAESTWPAGHSVLTDAELDELGSYLEAIHTHFKSLLEGGEGFAMDIEYKLTPGRRLLIKQARPFNKR